MKTVLPVSVLNQNRPATQEELDHAAMVLRSFGNDVLDRQVENADQQDQGDDCLVAAPPTASHSAAALEAIQDDLPGTQGVGSERKRGAAGGGEGEIQAMGHFSREDGHPGHPGEVPETAHP